MRIKIMYFIHDSPNRTYFRVGNITVFGMTKRTLKYFREFATAVLTDESFLSEYLPPAPGLVHDVAEPTVRT